MVINVDYIAYALLGFLVIGLIFYPHFRNNPKKYDKNFYIKIFIVLCSFVALFLGPYRFKSIDSIIMFIAIIGSLLLVVSFLLDQSNKNSPYVFLLKRFVVLAAFILPWIVLVLWPHFKVSDETLQFLAKNSVVTPGVTPAEYFEYKTFDSIESKLNEFIAGGKLNISKQDVISILNFTRNESVYQRVSSWALGLSIIIGLITSLIIIISSIKLLQKNKIDIEETITLSAPVFAPIVFLLLLALFGGIFWFKAFSSGLTSDLKMIFSLFYLLLFALFSFIYKWLLDKATSVLKSYHRTCLPAEKDKALNIIKRYTDELKNISDVFNTVDLPTALSFSIFFIFYWAIRSDMSHSITSYKQFGYGGGILHIFTSSILFLVNFADEYFGIPFPKLRR